PTIITSTFFPFFYSYGDPRDIHFFPTRRSSDLLMPGSANTRNVDPALKSNYLLQNKQTKVCCALSNSFGFGAADFRLLVLEKVVDRKSTRLNSSHVEISYAVFCLKKKIY